MQVVLEPVPLFRQVLHIGKVVGEVKLGGKPDEMSVSQVEAKLGRWDMTKLNAISNTGLRRIRDG